MNATHIEIGIVSLFVTKSGTIEQRRIGQTFTLAMPIPSQDSEVMFAGRRLIHNMRKILSVHAYNEMATCNRAELDGDGTSYYRFKGAE